MKVSSKQHHNLATHVSRQSIKRIALAALVLAIAEVSAQSTQTPTTQSAESLAQSDSPSANQNLVTSNAAGLVVAIDRDTGQTRSLTAAEAQKLAEGLKNLVSQSTEGLVQVRRANGMVSMDLQGRFQNALLARKEADGSIVQGCVDNLDNAAAFFNIDATLIGGAKRAVSRAPSSQLELR